MRKGKNGILRVTDAAHCSECKEPLCLRLGSRGISNEDPTPAPSEQRETFHDELALDGVCLCSGRLLFDKSIEFSDGIPLKREGDVDQGTGQAIVRITRFCG